MGYARMIRWEIRESPPLYDGHGEVDFEECSDNPHSLTDCKFKSGVCDRKGTQVFLHCKGIFI